MKKNLFLTTIAGIKTAETPVWMMRQAGRYLTEYREVRSHQPDFISFCLNPEKASEVTIQPITRFSMDAAIIFSDILLIPWALDRGVHFKSGLGPILKPMELPTDFNQSLIQDITKRLDPVAEAIKKTRYHLNNETSLIGFAGAPWTVITYMAEGKSSRDFTKARKWAWQNPKLMDILMESLILATVEFLTMQAEAGADALMLFDSWASIVPASQRNWLVIEPTKKIISSLREKKVSQPVIGFPRGFGDGLIQYANETGINALAIDQGVDPAWAHKNIPLEMPIQGNLDPLSLLSDGKQMMYDIDKIMDAFKDRPHVFNLGHGVTPETPVENVQLMVEHIRSRSYG